jgi:orotidine-5'-phosphate decarboxylase
MDKQTLISQIKKKRSFLCVGLDTDLEKIPGHLHSYKDPVFEFNRQIIEATKDYCVAYKPNLAFYESMGIKGWESLERTMGKIPRDHFTIADAKRGDIGNTADRYAKTFFEIFDFDSVTVAPYMGKDSVTPFLQFKNKWAILLALTSNEGAHDFQTLEAADGKLFFEKVLQRSKEWGSPERLMYVVGATQTDYLQRVRTIVPDHFLLVPGVGAQGGSLTEVCKAAMNREIGLLINSSRQIIYSSSGEDFAEAAAGKAKEIQEEMAGIMAERGIFDE